MSKNISSYGMFNAYNNYKIDKGVSIASKPSSTLQETKPDNNTQTGQNTVVYIPKAAKLPASAASGSIPDVPPEGASGSSGGGEVIWVVDEEAEKERIPKYNKAVEDLEAAKQACKECEENFLKIKKDPNAPLEDYRKAANAYHFAQNAVTEAQNEVYKYSQQKMKRAN